MPFPEGILESFEFDCEGLALLDTLVAVEIEAMSEAYDKLWSQLRYQNLSLALSQAGAAISPPGSPAARLNETVQKMAEQNQATAEMYLHMNAPDLASRLRIWKGLRQAVRAARIPCY